jgi:hypothetical protein
VESSDRQVVRTAGGVVYVIVADDTAQRRSTNPGPGVIHVYKADLPGIPNSFSEVDGADRPTSSGTNVLESPDSRLDRNGTVHIVYADNATNDLYYQTFSTVTDKWGPRTLLATNALTLDGGGVLRTGNAAIILDNNDVPHVAYTTTANTVAFVDDVGGVWTAPRTLSTGSVPVHPSLAAGANGAFYLTWLDNSTAATSTIKFKYEAPDGTWGADQTVASTDVRSNDTLDQSPSIALNAQDTPYIIYLSADDYQRVVYLAADGTWQHDDPTPNLYGHDPNVYLHGNDLYAFLGHDSYIHPSYQVQLAGHGWAPYQEVDQGRLDGSASVRWDPLRETDSNVIDYLYMEENTLGDAEYLSTTYYMAILPGAQAPPSTGVLLGDQDVGSTQDSSGGGTAEAFRTVAGASGTLRQISVYVDATATAGQAVVGVYADSGGHPGALLTQATIASLVTGAWNAVAVPSAPIMAGAVYWVAILAPSGSGTLAFRDLAGGGISETSASSTLQALPGTWASGTGYTDGSLSAYGQM